MLLELVARYYKFLWLLLGAVAFLKIVLSYYFNRNLEGINGIIFALLKWFSEEEQEMEDHTPRRTMMRVLNMVTFGIYFVLLMILLATFLPSIFGR
ncbi:MAG: hypothetical protein JWQ96_2293 [Segetibacter sp.]|nr:hypothetical protein [Segetibacter sp.]